MGLRFRRSLKIAPGVRLNFGLKSASVRLGPRGAGVTIGTKGKSVSAGLPGTGLHYTEMLPSRPNGRSSEGSSLSFVIGAVIAIALIVWLLSGCADYMSHRDTVTLGAGNAMAANVGIHAVNPFPPNAHDTTIYTSGGRVQRAMETYSGTPIGRGGGATANVKLSGKGLPGMGAGRTGADLDCSDFDGPVDVSAGDPNGLDADGDGTGCEPYNK